MERARGSGPLNHGFGVFSFRVELIGISGAGPGKSELEFEEPLRRNNDELVHVGNDIGQTRIFNARERAKSKFNSDGVSRNGTKTEQEREHRKAYSDTSDDTQDERDGSDAKIGRSGSGGAYDLHVG